MGRWKEGEGWDGWVAMRLRDHAKLRSGDLVSMVLLLAELSVFQHLETTWIQCCQNDSGAKQLCLDPCPYVLVDSKMLELFASQDSPSWFAVANH